MCSKMFNANNSRGLYCVTFYGRITSVLNCHSLSSWVLYWQSRLEPIKVKPYIRLQSNGRPQQWKNALALSSYKNYVRKKVFEQRPRAGFNYKKSKEHSTAISYAHVITLDIKTFKIHFVSIYFTPKKAIFLGGKKSL